MSGTLSINYDAREDHARWWHGEADQARQRRCEDAPPGAPPPRGHGCVI
jgi:hypothetical protein